MNPEDKLGGYTLHNVPNLPGHLNDALKLMQTNMTDEMEVQIYKSLNENIYASVGVPADMIRTTEATAPYTEKDLSKMMNDYMMQNEPQRNLIQKYSSDQLVVALCDKMGRRATSGLMNAIRDFIFRNTSSQVAEEPIPLKTFGKDGFIPTLVQHLESIPIVKGVSVLVEDLPESATLILKLDTNYFEDEETEKYMLMIEEILGTYKPGNVDALEIIFHNKVVY